VSISQFFIQNLGEGSFHAHGISFSSQIDVDSMRAESQSGYNYHFLMGRK